MIQLSSVGKVLPQCWWITDQSITVCVFLYFICIDLIQCFKRMLVKLFDQHLQYIFIYYTLLAKTVVLRDYSMHYHNISYRSLTERCKHKPNTTYASYVHYIMLDRFFLCFFYKCYWLQMLFAVGFIKWPRCAAKTDLLHTHKSDDEKQFSTVSLNLKHNWHCRLQMCHIIFEISVLWESVTQTSLVWEGKV